MCFLSAAESVLILLMWFHVCFYVALYAAKTQLPFGEKMKLNLDIISWDTELLSCEETESSAPSKIITFLFVKLVRLRRAAMQSYAHSAHFAHLVPEKKLLESEIEICISVLGETWSD